MACASGIRLNAAARRFASTGFGRFPRNFAAHHRRPFGLYSCASRCTETPAWSPRQTRRRDAAPFNSSASEIPERSAREPPMEGGSRASADKGEKADDEGFRDAVEMAVRSHLRRTYGDAFRCSWSDLLVSDPARRRGGAGGTIALEVVDVLASLNGYKRVQPFLSSSPSGSVELAEGVVALPRSGVEEDYRVYARPSEEAMYAGDSLRTRGRRRRRAHPPFTEDDYTVWSIMETKIDDKLNAWEESARRRFDAYSDRVRHPIQAAYEKAYLPMVRRLRQLTPTSKDDPDEDGESGVMKAHGDTLPSNGLRGDSIEAEEDLIIVSIDGSILLVENVLPRHRLLALPRPARFLPASFSSETSKRLAVSLRRSSSSSSAPLPPPYRLGHKRAGTVLSASLVLFGAAPMTYRSLLHALDYPALAGVVAFSVAGTVSYGLWSGRHTARTRRAGMVSEAVRSRASARDGAALESLREGAVRAGVYGVVRVYFDRLEDPPGRGRGRKEAELQKSEANAGDESSFRRSGLDMEELAVELGLLRRIDSLGVSNAGKDSVIEAVNFSDARSTLENVTLEFAKSS